MNRLAAILPAVNVLVDVDRREARVEIRRPALIGDPKAERLFLFGPVLGLVCPLLDLSRRAFEQLGPELDPLWDLERGERAASEVDQLVGSGLETIA